MLQSKHLKKSAQTIITLVIGVVGLGMKCGTKKCMEHSKSRKDWN